MDVTSNKKEETYRDLSILTFTLLSIKKKSSDEVKNVLVEMGLDEKQARYLVSVTEHRIIAEQKKAKEDMKVGGIVLMGGIGITSLTYLLSDYSHIYVVTWGVIIFGAFLLIRGFANWNG